MRNWTSVAVGSAFLLASACGGNDGETARADLESESIGGEGVASGEMRGGDDSYAQYDVDPMPPDDTSISGGMGADVDGMGAGIDGTARADTDVIESDDARDTFTGSGAEDADDRDVTGSGIGSTAPVDDDRFAQGAQPGTGMQPEQGVQPAAQGEVCPADIEGLNVRVSTIPRGGALVFTVAREQVEELRDRLDRFAALHRQQHQGMGAEGAIGAEGEMGAEGETGAEGEMDGMRAEGSLGGTEGEMHGEHDSQFVDAQALIHLATEVRVVDIPRGARLEFRFDDGERVRDLRAELREDATMLRDGRCPLALQLETT